MTYPKFAVGEDVLIYSETYPDIQGIEAVVIRREWWEAEEASDNTAGYRYWTTFQASENPWAESALRKRPSDFTFNELMESLKAPIPA